MPPWHSFPDGQAWSGPHGAWHDPLTASQSKARKTILPTFIGVMTRAARAVHPAAWSARASPANVKTATFRVARAFAGWADAAAVHADGSRQGTNVNGRVGRVVRIAWKATSSGGSAHGAFWPGWRHLCCAERKHPLQHCLRLNCGRSPTGCFHRHPSGHVRNAH